MKRVVFPILSLMIPMLVSLNNSATPGTANGSSSGTVVMAITVTAAQSLIFGNVLQGVPKTIDNDVDDSSGIFEITGEDLAGVSLQLTLPEYLAITDNSDRMTVAFNSSICTIDSAATSPGGSVQGWINVDPRNLPDANIGAANSKTNVYIGGKVIPSPQQKPGNYSGDIVLSVGYNGS
ncbi:MAG: DUF4402 domain-containing protein [candidate division Zixibacteria bacterium]|nr:DUF4402 domain-containing protein [candidate division Zixibacteria bacterium]